MFVGFEASRQVSVLARAKIETEAAPSLLAARVVSDRHTSSRERSHSNAAVRRCIPTEVVRFVSVLEDVVRDITKKTLRKHLEM
jgi:hypothetical protein